MIAAAAATAVMPQLHPARRSRVAAALLAAAAANQPRASLLQMGCRPRASVAAVLGGCNMGTGRAPGPFPDAWREG